MYCLPVVLLQKLSPSTIFLQVLHLFFPHPLTIVLVSWVASVTVFPTDVGFGEVTSKSQDGEVCACLPFFKGLGQESITLVCRASDRPLLFVAIFAVKKGLCSFSQLKKLSLDAPTPPKLPPPIFCGFFIKGLSLKKGFRRLTGTKKRVIPMYLHPS